MSELVQSPSAVQGRVESNILPNHLEFEIFLFDPLGHGFSSPMSPALRNQFPTTDHAVVRIKVKIREVKIKAVGCDAHTDGTK